MNHAIPIWCSRLAHEPTGASAKFNDRAVIAHFFPTFPAGSPRRRLASLWCFREVRVISLYCFALIMSLLFLYGDDFAIYSIVSMIVAHRYAPAYVRAKLSVSSAMTLDGSGRFICVRLWPKSVFLLELKIDRDVGFSSIRQKVIILIVADAW